MASTTSFSFAPTTSGDQGKAIGARYDYSVSFPSDYSDHSMKLYLFRHKLLAVADIDRTAYGRRNFSAMEVVDRTLGNGYRDLIID